MELLGSEGDDTLVFESLETGALLDIPYPVERTASEIEELITDVENCKTVIMEIHFPILSLLSGDYTVKKITVGPRVEEIVGQKVSDERVLARV